jgi:hypothetical protein
MNYETKMKPKQEKKQKTKKNISKKQPISK